MLSAAYRASCLSLLLVALVARAPLPAQQPQERVGGRVIDAKSGLPIPFAKVSLIDVRTEREAAETFAGGDGIFLFGQTPAAGKYRLVGEASRHLAGSYLQHDQFSTAIVTGAGLDTGALQLSLLPESGISGHVSDENGDPVSRAIITIYREGFDTGTKKVRPYGNAAINQDGSFYLSHLPPGRYYVSAFGTPWYAVHPPLDSPGEQQPYRTAIDPALNVAYPIVFYPAALRSEDALPLVIGEGEQVEVNLQFTPEPAVTLTLEQPHGSVVGQPPPMLTQTVFGEDTPVPTQDDFSAGKMRLSGLAPGRYNLKVFSGNGNQLPVAGGTVDLSSGSVTRDAPAPAVVAQVRLTLQTGNGRTLPQGSIVTMAAVASQQRTSVGIEDKGEAHFDNVPPGEYSFVVESPSGPLGSAIPVGDNQTVRDGHLVIAGSQTVHATLRITGPGVRVEGFVRHGATPVQAAMVLLVPAQKELTPELIHRDQSDLDGSFSIPDVPPGDYLLFALTDAWSSPWADLHLLAPHLLQAKPLHIPGDSRGVFRVSEPVEAQPLH